MEDVELPYLSFKDIVNEIEKHPASELVSFDYNAVNGYSTFLFRGTDGEVVAKFTFDEVSDDMVERAKAVLDHLSTTHKVTITQEEIQDIWDAEVNGFSL